MFPGLMTKLSEQVLASATSISPEADMVRLTGTTAIATIVPPPGVGIGGGIMIIVPTSGNIATTTAGNISLVVTMPVNRATVLVYSVATATWYPGAIS